jgi:hypothetical protein
VDADASEDGSSLSEGATTAVGPSPTAFSWREQPRRLRFRLGEVCIGSVNLRSLTLDTYFMNLVGGPLEPPLPFERFPRRTDVVIAGSYPVPGPLPRLTVLPHAIRYVPHQYRRHYVDLSGTFDAYLEKFSSKSRSTLRKKVRKFAEFSGGTLSWRQFRPEDLEDYHRLAIGVSNKTYQARLHLAAALPDLGGLREQVARYGDARGFVLFHETRPVAHIFCPVQEGSLLYQFVGYDPEYEQWSPGTVLQYLALESLFAEGGFRAFDFTEGEGAHKEFFANRDVQCADLYYFRKSARNYLAIGLHAGLHSASGGATRLLDRLGLKARIKKLIRSKA